jgi:GTP cyclohydrolase II
MYRAGGAIMENKKSKNHLRLVKPQEDVKTEAPTQVKTPLPVRSAFAKQMTDHADELDRMIEAILRA